MDQPDRLRVTIDVEPGVHPLSGRLAATGLPLTEFRGLIELISLLDRVADVTLVDGNNVDD